MLHTLERLGFNRIGQKLHQTESLNDEEVDPIEIAEIQAHTEAANHKLIEEAKLKAKTEGTQYLTLSTKGYDYSRSMKPYIAALIFEDGKVQPFTNFVEVNKACEEMGINPILFQANPTSQRES